MRYVRIRSLVIDDLAEANALIQASKAHWKQGEAYLGVALKLLQLDEAWIEGNLLFGLFEENELLGVIGIDKGKEEWHLEHLWIRPDCIGQGLGEMAVAHIKHLAKCQGVSKVLMFPEPPSEGFYEKMGAVYTGKRVPSRIDGGPEFREMSWQLS